MPDACRMAEPARDSSPLHVNARQQAVAYARAHRDDVLALIAELVAAPSENPPGDETRPADVVNAWLPRLGLAQSARTQK